MENNEIVDEWYFVLGKSRPIDIGKKSRMRGVNGLKSNSENSREGKGESNVDYGWVPKNGQASNGVGSTL